MTPALASAVGATSFPFYTQITIDGEKIYASAEILNLKKIPVITFLQDFYYRTPQGTFIKCKAVTQRHPELNEQFHADMFAHLG
jgi:hypothetical protein